MLYSALIFGLLGSFHCVGMCGPIAFLLPLDRTSPTKRVLQLLSYHTGRICMYSLLGLIFGIVGKSINILGFQQQLSIGIGVLMIITVLFPTKKISLYNVSKPIFRFISNVKTSMGAALKNKNNSTFFTLGYLNGLLPCGLVYMAIFGAIASGEVLDSSLYMAVFGLGTIPMMLFTFYISNFLTSNVKQYILKLIPFFVVIIGVLFILRGLGLGIPYISPSENITIEKVSNTSDCHE